MDSLRVLIDEILENTRLMSLGTSDDGGVWVSDLLFVHDESFALYWLSQEHVRHSQAILKNPVVAASITLGEGSGGMNKGLQIAGIAEKLIGDMFEMACKHRAKRNKPTPTKAGEILDSGESWYKLTPKKLELIYEPLFGFDKKVLLF